ncbi:diguanylate cyclase (GGDEF)-like protein/PAS domain S-box-containing protein [Pseudomonas sp. BIGb0408]|uniref:Diguanylate cyclase (GGDEF)-like protein/PAS domain S-box-containing protein n=1 Tax=Phytopseudomonas flavescens TaxID=29435 RepID=A0A7Y9XP74_9GAMM|nr:MULTISPECIES: EAL domain-containing protein [Pseudomonas]MCW2290416.1 diguanylate cyclase (GGDEF)-like protein/PAS domain S-box-containing protein [Pseudomonas sp. BIGb0408]NYH75011.1 diguanylate cyclase (GGDEF)-like protein/PAS domain S-box-containing protein [Pseudomonas flavescens]
MLPTHPNADVMYRLLVQSVVDYAIYMLSPEGVVTNWNAGAQRAKGYLAAEIVGQHFSVFYGEAERAAGVPERGLQQARDTGRFEAQGWRLRKDGTSFWAHVVIDAVHDDDGQLIGFAKITRDCTEQRQLQIEQREQERRFRLLVQGVTDYAIYMLDPQGHVENWNAGAERAKGYKAEEIVGQHFSVFYTPEDREAGLPAKGLETARSEGRFEAEGVRLRKDGSPFWTSVVIDAIYDDDRQLIGFAKITRDITERRQNELELLKAKELAESYSEEMASLSRFLDSVISNIPASVIVQDSTSREILLANPRAEKLFGCSTSEMLGRRAEQCLAPAIVDYIAEQTEQCIRSGAPHLSEDCLDTQLGPRMLRTRVLQSSGVEQQSSYLLMIAEDVTDELAAHAQIHHMAHHDALTGLPNRTLFGERLDEALREGEEKQRLTAVLCLDLDNFKNINDALGHAFGDRLLRSLGQRLKGVLRERDTLARLGGDEFAVVLNGLESAEDAQRTAKRLIAAVAPVFLIDGHSFSVGVSIGVALSPDDHQQADQLMRYADLALYEAKRNGRNRYECFHPELDVAARRRRTMEMDLRTALHLGQLQLYYQPIVDNGSNLISGYEALMRWQHPSNGLVMPMDFIPIAEETGLIHDVGARALNLACQEAASWSGKQTVAVNLSPVQFKNADLVKVVGLALADSGLEPERLELEITESVLLENSEGNIDTLKALKALGVNIALDDFGTGYSSLGYLRSFSFDRIKIDKSFVQDMGESRESLSIVRAITGMSGSLLIKTTAEGVETDAQFEQLKAEGCSHFQGYLFGRPQPASERIEVLE